MSSKVKKQRWEIPVTKTEYKTDGFTMLTLCPFGRKTKLGKAFPVKCGSGACRECKSFISDDTEKQILSCKGK